MPDTMQQYADAAAPGVVERFAALADVQSPSEYNFCHFERRHLAYDARATLQARGVAPGEPAPDFALPRVGGGTFRLSAYRGRLVLLHFGSPT